MKYFDELRKEWKLKRYMRRVKYHKKRAQEKYQIEEYNGVLWITLDGTLVVPESLLGEDAITVVKKLRDMYVERMLKDLL